MTETDYEEKVKNFSQSVDTYTRKPKDTIMSILTNVNLPTNSNQFGFKFGSTDIEVLVLLARTLSTNYYCAESSS